ncbi:hypothetical protein [Kitasatospora purpeofusca]|uniref:hypothetical protein n=1 Tax=Kitasatospora purpeofusca TaxID=67352 RepID=UPI00380E4F37
MLHTTANGETIEVTRYGSRVEMHLRAPDGRTMASVNMSERDAEALMNELWSN